MNGQEYPPKERRPVSFVDGVVTVSRKRLRLYPHKFDWDAATARYLAGDSVSAIARDLGVDYNAVKRVVDPTYYRRLSEQQKQRTRIGGGACRDCGTPISRNYSQPVTRCRECSAAHLRTTVRETTLRCRVCGEWKPDESFFRNGSLAGRRYRRTACKPCDVAARRETRQRARKKQ